MTEPTDAELIALLGDRQFSTIGAVREALRRWGTPPAVAGETAEHYRNAIASACEGWTMPDGLRKHLETALWSPPTPQPTQPQAGAVPLTGEYPALVCDYCGALTPDPWHSSGMLHGKMSKHIHSCDACASHGQAPAQPDPAYSAACHLATALFKKYFAHLPDFASGQAVWGLCGSTAGVISQIDNMVSGLLQPPTTAFSEDEPQ